MVHNRHSKHQDIHNRNKRQQPQQDKVTTLHYSLRQECTKQDAVESRSLRHSRKEQINKMRSNRPAKTARCSKPKTRRPMGGDG